MIWFAAGATAFVALLVLTIVSYEKDWRIADILAAIILGLLGLGIVAFLAGIWVVAVVSS